jgi:hypothetical protein
MTSVFLFSPSLPPPPSLQTNTYTYINTHTHRHKQTNTYTSIYTDTDTQQPLPPLSHSLLLFLSPLRICIPPFPSSVPLLFSSLLFSSLFSYYSFFLPLSIYPFTLPTYLPSFPPSFSPQPRLTSPLLSISTSHPRSLAPPTFAHPFISICTLFFPNSNSHNERS